MTMERIHALPGLLLAGAFSAATAQTAVELKQQSLARWGIGTAQYSGIAPMGEGRYALVSDNEPADGFFVFRIAQDSLTGEVASVTLEGFRGKEAATTDSRGNSLRDAEGVAFVPDSRTVFISGEGDQRVLEYDLQGRPTGRQLAVPACFGTDNIYPNYGFEALAYCPATRLFWTTTECPLRADGVPAGPLNPGGGNLLRIQAFGPDLQPAAQYAYRMDRPSVRKLGGLFIFGVSALAALPDGSLLVLEREADVKPRYMGSTVTCKIFRVRPQESWQIDSQTDMNRLDAHRFMVKEPVAAFTTRVSALRIDFANYEGMCPGIRLSDGRQTILLVSDSQGGAGKGPFRLKDYIKVLVLN